MSGDWRGTLWTLLITFCIVIIRCTETFWSPCSIVQHTLIVKCNSVYVHHKRAELFVLRVKILSCWNVHAVSSLLRTIDDTANSPSLITNTTRYLKLKYPSNTAVTKNEASVVTANCNIDCIAWFKVRSAASVTCDYWTYNSEAPSSYQPGSFSQNNRITPR
jgi:hypothetical protein